MRVGRVLRGFHGRGTGQESERLLLQGVFEPSRRGTGHAYCSLDCQQADFKTKNPHYRRERMLQEKYSMSLADYNALFTRQAGVCAVCRQEPDVWHGGLCVDHDHDTGEVRGLLCDTCNKGIGLLRDNPEYLDAAAAYLRAHRLREAI
jgi:hypothetical protein